VRTAALDAAERRTWPWLPSLDLHAGSFAMRKTVTFTAASAC
jgi:hypothetical protein